MALRALARDLAAHVGGRSDEDAVLALLVPELRPSMRAYYAGRGDALDELLDCPSVRALDEWLSTEISRWDEAWSALDPARGGEAASTRAARDDLVSRIAGRPLPDGVATLVNQCAPGRLPPRPRPRRARPTGW